MGITRISTTAAGALATTLKAQIDAGSGPALLKVYSGTIPINADTALSGQTLLGTLTCSDPCGSVSGKTILFDAITQDSSADATGTASFARLLDSDLNVVIDVDITAFDGGGTLQLNTINIVAGGPIIINTFSITVS